MKAVKAPVKQRTCREEEPVSPINTDEGKDILAKVFAILGKPKDLCQLSPNLTRISQVSRFSFRVNICRNMPTPKYTATFWVQANEDGEIVSSTPPIVKKY